MPEHDVTVGTEAMSDRARPRSMEGVRLVEEGRRQHRREVEVPCPDNRHVRALAWRIARVEAASEDRGVRMIAGSTYEDLSALPDEGEAITFGDLGYSGSHDLIEGHVATHADLCALALRCERALDECMEQFVAERGAE